jgi:hypothetical protein
MRITDNVHTQHINTMLDEPTYTHLLASIAAHVGTDSPLPYLRAATAAIHKLYPPPPSLKLILSSVTACRTGLHRLREVVRLAFTTAEHTAVTDHRPLADTQRDIVWCCVYACLPAIVGLKEYQAAKEEFLAELNMLSGRSVKKDNRMLIIYSHRQSGKSTSLAVFISALMRVCWDINIGVFASALNQSGIIVDHVRTILQVNQIVCFCCLSNFIFKPYTINVGMRRGRRANSKYRRQVRRSPARRRRTRFSDPQQLQQRNRKYEKGINVASDTLCYCVCIILNNAGKSTTINWNGP